MNLRLQLSTLLLDQTEKESINIFRGIAAATVECDIDTVDAKLKELYPVPYDFRNMVEQHRLIDINGEPFLTMLDKNPKEAGDALRWALVQHLDIQDSVPFRLGYEYGEKFRKHYNL